MRICSDPRKLESTLFNGKVYTLRQREVTMTKHKRYDAELKTQVVLEVLKEAHIQISMAARGRPTENAYSERLMRTLKEEEVYLHEYEDIRDARAHIAHFLDQVYMHKR